MDTPIIEKLPDIPQAYKERARQLIVRISTHADDSEGLEILALPKRSELTYKFPCGALYRHFTQCDPKNCDPVAVRCVTDNEYERAVLAAALGLRDNIRSH